MLELQLGSTTLCFAAGPALNWEGADNYCFDAYRANMCTLMQWRTAVCKAGVGNPGRSWTPTPTGNGGFATVAGCSFEQISIAFGTSAQAATCCLEWPVY